MRYQSDGNVSVSHITLTFLLSCYEYTVVHLFIHPFMHVHLSTISTTQRNATPQNHRIRHVYIYNHLRNLTPQKRLYFFPPHNLSLVHCDSGYGAAAQTVYGFG